MDQIISINAKKNTPMIIVILILITVFYSILKELIHDWYVDSNYSHGFLIPVISIYLIWQKKKNMAVLQPSKSYLGLLIFLIGITILIVGTAAAEFFSVRLSFLIVLFGLTLFFYGKDFIKKLWFPLVFLIFMIPIPYVIYYSVTFPLQILSTKFATAFLQLIGFTILRQGNIIHLQNYSLEVVEACSGLRSLMTLSALGAAMAYITQKDIYKGVFLFLLSVPIAIGANVFRIIITALGAYFISPKFAEGFLHEISGLVVFLVGFVSLGLAGMIINRIDKLKYNEPN